MNPTDTRQIAFVLYPGLTPLDLIGPLQTLAPLPRIDPTFEVLVVGEHTDVVADRRRRQARPEPHLRRRPDPRSRSSSPAAASPRWRRAGTSG